VAGKAASVHSEAAFFMHKLQSRKMAKKKPAGGAGGRW
jgi:hypothetical protein